MSILATITTGVSRHLAPQAYQRRKKVADLLSVGQVLCDGVGVGREHVGGNSSHATALLRRQAVKDAFNDDILKGSRYYWLTGFERLTERPKLKFDKLFEQKLETGVASSFKEMLRDLWLIPNKRAATAFFRSWCDKVVNTGLKPLISDANAINERLAHVVNYTARTALSMRSSRDSTARSWPLNDAWAVIGTGRTSRLPSTSTAVAWTCTHTEPGWTSDLHLHQFSWISRPTNRDSAPLD